MSTYASKTTVTAEASRSEIEKILTRYGADQFMYGWDRDRAIVGFRAHDRQVKFLIEMPDRADPTFTRYERGKYGSIQTRTPEAAEKLWEQACRQRWRALALVIKAKLEAVEAGLETFETSFMAQTVLPNGQTVAEWMEPQIEKAYATGSMPPMLLALEAGPG